MKIAFSLYFRYSDDLLLQLFDLIKANKFGFSSEVIILDNEYDFTQGVNLLNINIKEYIFNSGLIVKDNSDLNSLMIFIKNEKKTVLNVTFKYESLTKYFDNEEFLVETLIYNNSDFIIAHADDYEFTIKEDISDIQTFELLYGKVSRHKIQKDSDGFEYIDTKSCYGRTEYISGIGFRVSWRMYFGQLFYQKDTIRKLLLSYKKGHSNKLLNNAIFIELYHDPQDYLIIHNYNLLNDFRVSVLWDTVITSFDW